MDGFLYRYAGVERSFDWLSGERISFAIFLHVLLYSCSIIALTTICDDWILHQIESDPADQILRNCED